MQSQTKKVVLGILVVLVLAGVAFGYSQQRSAQLAEMAVPVRVGYFQSHMGSAPILVGESKGFFADAGVTVEKTILGSSNLAMDALVRGDVDISLLSLIPVLNAEAVQSGNVRVFAVSQITNDAPFDSVVVQNSSDIESIQDLAGKKIAVFPGTTATAFLRHYLESQNVDTSGIEFIQMPLAEHLVALESGAVSAAHMYEPVLSIALESGDTHVLMGSVYASTSVKSPIGVYVISTKFLTEHPELAKRAVAALEGAMAYSNAHPDEARKAVGDEFKLDQSVASRMSLLSFVPAENNSALTSFIDLLISFGEVKAQPDLDTLLYR